MLLIFRVASINGQNACQHLKRGGFSRTIYAQQPKALARLHAKAYAVYGTKAAVKLGSVPSLLF